MQYEKTIWGSVFQVLFVVQFRWLPSMTQYSDHSGSLMRLALTSMHWSDTLQSRFVQRSQQYITFFLQEWTFIHHLIDHLCNIFIQQFFDQLEIYLLERSTFCLLSFVPPGFCFSQDVLLFSPGQICAHLNRLIKVIKIIKKYIIFISIFYRLVSIF